MTAIKRTVLIPGLLGILTAAMVVSVGPMAIAQTPQEMIATAEKACIDAAVAKGYDEQLSNVVSAESLDSNTVEVVLNLTKDGQGFARLTCPYTVDDGIAVFDDAGAVFENAADAVTGAAETVTRTRFPWWLLLIPLIGLPLLLWLFRGRDRATTREVSPSTYTEGYAYTHGNPLNVYETPSDRSPIIRTFTDGTRVLLSGRQEDQWLELREGGWVNIRSLRFDERSTRRYA